MALEDIDIGNLGSSLQMVDSFGTIMKWIQIIAGIIIFFGILFMLFTMLKYNTKVIIWDKGIPTQKRARKTVTSGKVVEYEFLDSFGKSKAHKDTFMIKWDYSYPLKGFFVKELIILQKAGDGAYHPVPYNNLSSPVEVDVPESSIQTETVKGKLPFSKKTIVKGEQKIAYKKVRVRGKLETINQPLMQWLVNKIRQVNEKYDEKKWWEPYIFPMSIVVVAMISFLMIVLTLDKVENINQFCTAAANKLSQQL